VVSLQSMASDVARSQNSSRLPRQGNRTALFPYADSSSTFQEMERPRQPHRFDVFECRQNERLKFVVWCGTYKSLAEAEEKLHACAAESPNEFYVKDLELGVIVARANVSDGAVA